MNKQEIIKLAALNKLSLTESEAADVDQYLEFAISSLAKLTDIETDNVEPMIFGVDLSNVFREDVTAQPISRELVLEGAPEQEDNCFRVPMVLED